MTLTAFITPQEKRQLDSLVGSSRLFFFKFSFANFNSNIRLSPPPYALSEKQADGGVLPPGHTMPFIVFESGFSESFKELKDDLDPWIKDG